jgi:hypothetical protein
MMMRKLFPHAIALARVSAAPHLLVSKRHPSTSLIAPQMKLLRNTVLDRKRDTETESLKGNRRVMRSLLRVR